ncbi:N-acetyltransferase [Pseudothauera nasutitermitis]|uniref:N-acetyltransferase n=1 Tax=Pseudothauera nasutitermitis TaxID=2565930 RepID=A0A4S4B4C1_9RHOO|nr:N-acetyltransferase [Pseudothauera nasutitermitis]
MRPEHCEFVQLRSADDEAAFFAQMGRFFASATVRRECGGYPLNDGPRYRWFIVRLKGQARVLGFISIEQQADVVRIREGYVRAEARGLGLFRALRGQVLDYVDGLGLDCTMRMPEACARFLAPHGFQVRSTRGRWVTLVRNVHAGSHEADGTGRGPVPRVGSPAAGAAGGGHQPDTPVPA